MLRHARVHLIADRQKAQLLRTRPGASSYRAQKHFVQPPIVIPPRCVFALLHGALQVALGGFERPAEFGHVKGNNAPVWQAKIEKVAPSQFPPGSRRVLDGQRVLGRHLRFHYRQVREHRGGARELLLTLMLHAFKCADRRFRAIAHLPLRLHAYRMPDYEQQRTSQAADNQQRGDEELCAQPEMSHCDSIVLTNAPQELALATELPGTNLYPAPWIVRKNRGLAESGSS